MFRAQVQNAYLSMLHCFAGISAWQGQGKPDEGWNIQDPRPSMVESGQRTQDEGFQNNGVDHGQRTEQEQRTEDG